MTGIYSHFNIQAAMRILSEVIIFQGVKTQLKRFKPGSNPTIETVLTKRGVQSQVFSFAADIRGNVLLWETDYSSSQQEIKFELYLNGHESPVTPTIEGKAFPKRTNTVYSWVADYTP